MAGAVRTRSAERLWVRLHFTAPGNTAERAALVDAIKDAFDVPDDVQMYLVRHHWLNVNPVPAVADEVLGWLAENLPGNVIAVYAMNPAAAASPALAALSDHVAGSRR
ncbi:hypothetical protein DVS28_b0173 (plasmid) [Euzebya pacifica]|uniref:Uncharacterized protein n=1 Tax=Euzebya pacifica TaxID=1608957 RepID=A0A346Y646_9ACTN|nr:hypothetical protein [Euzebya pacifica]AXV09943.1 hypothetical protein DVS28_b0173 [Euzebya pacifica]